MYFNRRSILLGSVPDSNSSDTKKFRHMTLNRHWYIIEMNLPDLAFNHFESTFHHLIKQNLPFAAIQITFSLPGNWLSNFQRLEDDHQSQD